MILSSVKRYASGLLGIFRQIWRARHISESFIDSFCYFLGSTPLDFTNRFRIGALKLVGRKQDWLGLREIFVDGEYDVVDVLLKDMNSPKVLDLGANIGGFALRVFHSRPHADIVSVEAAPDTFLILEKNQMLNASLKWMVLQAGVWASDGTLALDRGAISTAHKVVDREGGEQISCMSLGTLLERVEWDRLDLVKMDIEGAEAVVVPAAVELLARIDTLIIEVHTDRIDPRYVYDALDGVYAKRWRLEGRSSSKPVFVCTNRAYRADDNS